MTRSSTIALSVFLTIGLCASSVHAAKPACTDGDNDTYSPDGKNCGPVDCDDTDPTVWSLNSCGVCAPEGVGCTCTVTEDPEVSCSDGVDNDCDGAIDGADSDCATGGSCADYQDKGTCNTDTGCEWVGSPKNGQCVDATSCTVTENPETSCADGVDNDCDGAIDGADSDCATSSSRDVVVMANNDLGMHCACPGSEKMLLLPPFNTLRAQVIERGGQSPVVLSDPADIRVEYDILENYDDFNSYKADDPSKTDLRTDMYFSTWMEMMPKYGFGSATVDDPNDPNDGAIRGLTGAMLAGEMDSQSEGWWEVVGVPAFPDANNSTGDSSCSDTGGDCGEYIMVDPLGGPNRNPYLTAEVKVYEQSSDKLLASTTATVPVAFGGCCNCHLQLTADNGLDPNPDNSFNLMGELHARDTVDIYPPNGINIALLDPDGDGTTGPVRCSVCHLDPAMGESVAPGGYVDPANGNTLPTSQYTFSDVLHRWHVENSAVLAYEPDLKDNCYACHPSNEVNCYRGHHTDKTIGADNHAVWCTDCHGDLEQRVAEGQLQAPWSPDTMPTCQKCHSATGENQVLHAFGGSFLKSMSHKNDKLLCSTCHGSPHALNPSTLAKDNAQNISLQGQYVGQDQGAHAIGVCKVCHTNKKGSYSKPAH